MSALLNIKTPKPQSLTVCEYYSFLMAEYPIKPIKNKEENAYYLDLYATLRRELSEHPEKTCIREYLAILGTQIKKFEKKAFPSVPDTPGYEMLNYFMEMHHLQNKDLVGGSFSTHSAISMARKGVRPLTLSQIKELAERFHVSLETFAG